MGALIRTLHILCVYVHEVFSRAAGTSSANAHVGTGAILMFARVGRGAHTVSVRF